LPCFRWIKIGKREKRKKLSSRCVIRPIFIVILTDYSKELSLITQICNNPTCGEKKIFYSPSYSFIVTNDYSGQDKGLEKRIELWTGYYVDENSLPLNFQLF